MIDMPMTKSYLENQLQQTIKLLQEKGKLPDLPSFVQLEATRDKQHGDFATNIAMVLSKAAKKKPREIAELILSHLEPSVYLQKAEIAGPGFINFYLSSEALASVITTILAEGDDYGRCKLGREKSVLIEFLSSNPTGPLHVGHGRHAAFGAVIANLLAAVGFKPYREYYINDAGRQMDILTASIFLRYLDRCGETIVFPANGYLGDYVIDIAKSIHETKGDHFRVAAEKIFSDLPLDEPQGGDKEVYIDALILRVKTLLADQYDVLFDLGLAYILADIRNDLTEFGVHYDNWFSERAFTVNTEVVDQLIEKLKSNGDVYEREGALWFRSTGYGDEKDRVLIRSNGQRTYFANDAAYHINKFDRGFDMAIDIFGSDHHGYMARMKAIVEASAIDPERLIYLLVQFVTLYRHGEQVQMSTRGGNFVTLRELREEVGNDAARFFYVMRKHEQHMDFDLDLAKAQSNENPVYYVQYAYARICSVIKQMQERQWVFNQSNGLSHLPLLVTSHERALCSRLSQYPEMIIDAAIQYQPHLLTTYLRELATDFHAYYNSEQFLVEETALRDARLALVFAVKQVLSNGFKLLGITALESM